MSKLFETDFGIQTQIEVLSKILHADFGGVTDNDTPIEAAVRVLRDQQNRLNSIRDIVGHAQVVDVAPTKADLSILFENTYREMNLLENATRSSSGASPVSPIRRLATDFLNQYGAELFGDPALHMKGPVSQIHGNVVEGRTRRMTARYKAEIGGGNTYNTQLVFGQLADEFRAAIAELAKEGKVMCPYVPLTSAGVVIDPESFEPVIGFLTRYGVADAPK